jgi:tRNA-specific 2-thiouridylase
VWTCGVPGFPLRCLAQLRAHGSPEPATVTADGDGWRVSLDAPARGIAAGQAVVLYDGDVVLGSATIASAHSRALS